MFSSLKKWVKSEENAQSKQPPAGLQTMRSDLQKKFAKGVQYNLKIVIRGDRNSGKTCLWHRLQGHKFVEEYVPTPEIQVTSIQWNYKATDDVVKVDVWDVVDKGKPKQQSASLKLTHEEEDDDQCRLDANFLDVYKGAHAVLMVFDITKKWTYQYVEKELPKIPAHIPVLVLANHRDMGDHRAIELDELQALVETVERPAGSAHILYLESSMKSGFGLKYIHKFFNLPFLLVQRESLLKQLETNHLDVESCLEELHYEPSSEEQNYDSFLRSLNEKQNQAKKPKPSPDTTSPKVNGQDTSPPRCASSSQLSVKNPSKSPEQPRKTNPPTSLNVKSETTEQKSTGSGLFSPSMMTSASPTEPNKEPEKKGFMSRFFKGSSNAKQEARKNSEGDAPVVIPTAPQSGRGPVDIDKFVPDDEGTDNFLNEIPESTSSKRFNDEDNDLSSDEDGGNPMVAGFQEELDSDDQINTEAPKVYSYSDSDDDYTTSPKRNTTVPTPVSTRSAPKSRLSPKPHVEDVKLQHLSIDSDNDSEENTPYIMPDEDTISDVETSNQKAVTYDYSSPEETVRSLPIKKESSAKSKSNKSELSKPAVSKPRASLDITDDASSEDDTAANAMVSTVIEDVASDDDLPESPKPQEEEAPQQIKFQLDTNDFDFLEQISTSAQEQTPSTTTSQKSSKSTKHKSKSKKKHDDEDGTRKHKHKKKKSRSRETDSTETKSSKKKSSKKKTAEENALEEFLAGGEDSF